MVPYRFFTTIDEEGLRRIRYDLPSKTILIGKVIDTPETIGERIEVIFDEEDSKPLTGLLFLLGEEGVEELWGSIVDASHRQGKYSAN